MCAGEKAGSNRNVDSHADLWMDSVKPNWRLIQAPLFFPLCEFHTVQPFVGVVRTRGEPNHRFTPGDAGTVREIPVRESEKDVLYCPRVLGQWFDGIRFYAAASSPTRSRRTWAGLR